MVQKKPFGDVFPVYVCVHILSRVRCSFLYQLLSSLSRVVLFFILILSSQPHLLIHWMLSGFSLSGWLMTPLKICHIKLMWWRMIKHKTKNERTNDILFWLFTNSLILFICCAAYYSGHPFWTSGNFQGIHPWNIPGLHRRILQKLKMTIWSTRMLNLKITNEIKEIELCLPSYQKEIGILETFL